MHVDFSASELINHPDFNSYTLDYDFAMIKLDRPVDFASYPHIRPICLPTATSGTFEGVTATVTGWGWTQQILRSSTTKLLEVDVNVLSNNACKNDYSYRSTEIDRKSTRLNSSHSQQSRMPSSA